MFTLEGIDHVALSVRDVKRSVEWYQTVMGLSRRYQDAWGDFPAVVGVGTTSIALFPMRDPNSNPGTDRGTVTMRHLAFRANATNFAAAQGELRRRGIAFETQDHGIAHSIYFRDPDGHEIEITTYDLRG